MWASAQTSSVHNTANSVTAPPSFAQEILGIILPLIFIIIILYVILQLLRKRYRLTGDDVPLTVKQILPVGPRERVVLVETRAGRVFVIGVAANAVNYLTELTEHDVKKQAETVERIDTAQHDLRAATSMDIKS